VPGIPIRRESACLAPLGERRWERPACWGGRVGIQNSKFKIENSVMRLTVAASLV
jgi:hypothetical protein